ncbi:MAG: anaerobic ribonucleoside-triphosphate reductase activating protein [Oscillospiraceae bacterium]|nr:anaerobic ribonucleoside-triphosphate reductase activating protein [Oscillospiraceae bacterium]
MNIQGFQKLTMLDFPGKTACTVFTGGCNLRCPFCHNVPLVLSPEKEGIDENEIFSYLDKRRGVLDGVAITGGEPLIQRDIADFIKKIKSEGFLVKLDTNGFFPSALEDLLNEGLIDYVAMDVKNSREKYALTCGRENLDLSPFEKSLKLLKQGKTEYELRTTVIKEFHTVSDIESICRWIEGAPRYYLQAFKDSGILKEGSGSPLSEEEMIAMRDAARRFIPVVELRGI